MFAPPPEIHPPYRNLELPITAEDTPPFLERVDAFDRARLELHRELVQLTQCDIEGVVERCERHVEPAIDVIAAKFEDVVRQVLQQDSTPETAIQELIVLMLGDDMERMQTLGTISKSEDYTPLTKKDIMLIIHALHKEFKFGEEFVEALVGQYHGGVRADVSILLRQLAGEESGLSEYKDDSGEAEDIDHIRQFLIENFYDQYQSCVRSTDELIDFDDDEQYEDLVSQIQAGLSKDAERADIVIGDVVQLSGSGYYALADSISGLGPDENIRGTYRGVSVGPLYECDEDGDYIIRTELTVSVLLGDVVIVSGKGEIRIPDDVEEQEVVVVPLQDDSSHLYRVLA